MTVIKNLKKSNSIQHKSCGHLNERQFKCDYKESNSSFNDFSKN